MQITNYTYLHSKNFLYSKSVKGLQGCGDDYGFAFNGKEKDDEVNGEGNAYDYGDRLHDVRLGLLMPK